MLIHIKMIDTIYCQAVEGLQEIKKLISYEATYYKQTQYRKVKVSYRKTLVSRSGVLYTGFIPKIKKYCIKKGYVFKLEGGCNVKQLIPKAGKPKLKGITLRPDQMKHILKTHKKHRGLIVSPTGTGKTVIAAGIISSYKGAKCLFLCHTNDLVHQSYDEFKNLLGADIGLCTKGSLQLSKGVTVASRQTFIKYSKKLATYFDIVMVDEAHHVAADEGQYGKILRTINAPIRIGFTATAEKKGEAKLVATGLIGPKISALTLDEGNELGLLAKPTIRIMRVKETNKLANMSYREVYKEGIVKNIELERSLLKVTKEYMAQDKSILIFVVHIKHGRHLKSLLSKHLPGKVYLINGGTSSEKRNTIKKKLISKKTRCVIASVVWKEGVNIPSLDVLINAGGGVKEGAIIQMVGRALRLTKTKRDVVVVDFFDNSNKYLISHFGQRMCVYSDLGWL